MMSEVLTFAHDITMIWAMGKEVRQPWANIKGADLRIRND